jgi:flavodoxin
VAVIMRAVLCNRAGSTSHKAALIFKWPVLFCIDDPPLDSFELLVVIVANYGDEELQPEMERYLLKCEAKNIRYALCELGNYFGFEDDCFGCKKEALRILDEKSWVCMDQISIDSFPELDKKKLMAWVKKIHGAATNI